MINLDKNTVSDLVERNVEKILIFFYDSGCSWTKVDISEDFVVWDDLVEIEGDYKFKIYNKKNEKEQFENCNITKTVTADHTGKEKVRYIFSSK